MLMLRKGEPVLRMADASARGDFYSDVNKACTKWLNERDGLTPEQRKAAYRDRFRFGHRNTHSA